MLTSSDEMMDQSCNYPKDNINKPLLSFTIHHRHPNPNCGATPPPELLLSKTLSLLECEFIITSTSNNKTTIHVEITKKANFGNVNRKTIFDSLLSIQDEGQLPCWCIEPMNTDHIFFGGSNNEHNNVHIAELNSGALVCGQEGEPFQFFLSSSLATPLDLNQVGVVLHDEWFGVEGKFVLFDESALKYVLIVKDKRFNHFAKLGSGEIPEVFHKCKIFHVKLKVFESQFNLDSISDMNSEHVKYFLEYIQDTCPLVKITPKIFSMLSEGLERLSNSDSFSENALALSMYSANFFKIIQSNPFSCEDQIVTQFHESMGSLTFNFTDIKDRFIRCITTLKNQEDGILEYQVHLPQLAESNRLFRKLGTDGFIKVKIVGQVPNEIQCCRKTYRPLGISSSSFTVAREMYFYDTSQYESVESIMSNFVDDSCSNTPHSLDITLNSTTETIKIDKWACFDNNLLDGTGKISKTTARSVCEFLGLKGSVPSSFEIQFLGFKGTLAVLPDEDLEGNQIILRGSMLKFKSKPNFDILEYISSTNSGECGNLTCSMINTLIGLGIQPVVFQSLFQEWFSATLENMTHSKFLLGTLKSNCKDTLPALQNLDELPDDPFIEEILRYLMTSHLHDVKRNLLIPVEKSITCLSLFDEYNFLSRNEVMIILGNDCKYLEDGTKVIVCREPCLRQSDTQYFTVRNSEMLKTKYETNHSVAIFSSDCTQIKCERIFVSWDPRILPTNHSLPLDIKSDQCCTYNPLNIENYLLRSSILDGWIAVSDKEGAFSKKAVELSHLYNDIGNSEVPDWFDSIEYPDFMERPGKSYISNSILGRIYHRLSLMKHNFPNDISIQEEVEQGDTSSKLIRIMEYLKVAHNCSIFDLMAGNGKKRSDFIQFLNKLSGHFDSIEHEPSIISWINRHNKKITSKLDINKKLSNSVKRYMDNFRLDQLDKIENKLNGYKKNIEEQMCQKDDIYIVGSLSILLHDPNQTDCDWYIEPVSDNAFFDNLCNRLSGYFKPVKEEYHKSVPLFRMYLLDRDVNFLELIDLTNGDTGLRKKHHMRLYLSQQPKILLILRILFDILKKICSFHIKTFQLTWEIVDFCILRNYIHKEIPPTRQESVEQEKYQSDSVFMKSILSECMKSSEFEKESVIIIDFMKTFKLKNIMEFPDNLDDSKSYSSTSDERKIEYAHDLIQTCLVNLYLHRDFSKAVLSSQVIQKTFEGFKNVDAKPVFRADSRDFVDGSVMTIFKGDSGNSPINFTFYKGHVHAQHAKLPIHRPSLENYCEESNIIPPLYDQKLSGQLMKMEDKPENYLHIIRFGIYYLVNMQKSIFSEIPKPENTKVYNECMKKKSKVVKGPSADSFATGVNECVIPLLRPIDAPVKMTEYSVSFYKNVNNKLTEFKVRLDENMKLKTKIISNQLRVISHTFIGKSNDMRFYINHLQYLDENSDVAELVYKLDKKGWLIKQGPTDSEIVFNKKLELVRTIRKEERETFTIQRDGELLELDIIKVCTYSLPQNSRNQTLHFKEEHYEVEITLPNNTLHSHTSCLNLIRCGIDYWNRFIDND